jgi:hypothetical protein
LLLRLYPRQWRDRYEDEFIAMLEQREVSAEDYFDVLVNAALARLNPRWRTQPQFREPKSRFSRGRREIFPDNMKDASLEHELYRIRSRNSHTL